MWKNWAEPPAPFNPEAKPYAREVGHKVAQAMEAEGFYKEHTREECAAEYQRRYDAEMARRER